MFHSGTFEISLHFPRKLDFEDDESEDDEGEEAEEHGSDDQSSPGEQ